MLRKITGSGSKTRFPIWLFLLFRIFTFSGTVKTWGPRRFSVESFSEIYDKPHLPAQLLFKSTLFEEVWRSQNVFPDPGSDFFPSHIRFFPSRIRIKESMLNGFNQIRFVSFSKYDPGLSRMRILTFFPSRFSDYGSKRHRIPDPDPQNWLAV